MSNDLNLQLIEQKEKDKWSRSMVGASKVSLATLLVVGIFYEEVVFVSALLMAFFMICAQVAHIVVKNPLKKYIPSFLLLILSLFVAAVDYGLL